MIDEETPASTIRSLGPNNRRPSIGEIGLNQFAPYLLNRIAARWNVNLADALRERQTTTVKLRVMAVLSVSNSLTVGELSVLAVTEQSTMSRTLDAMEEEGLIVRRQLDGNLRTKHVDLTDKGRTVFQDLWPEMYDRFTKMFEGISDDEYRAFVGCLHKILGNIRHNPI